MRCEQLLEVARAHEDGRIVQWSERGQDVWRNYVRGEMPCDYKFLDERLEWRIKMMPNVECPATVNAELLEACRFGAHIFRRYEQVHLRKCTNEGNDEATNNAVKAKVFEAAIRRAEEERKEQDEELARLRAQNVKLLGALDAIAGLEVLNEPTAAIMQGIADATIRRAEEGK